MARKACIGCGLELEEFDGPTHPYLGASAACWALFGEVLAREFSDARYARLHGTTVDAYAVQHPGAAERRTIRSVALHGIRLLLVVEQQKPQDVATQIMSRIARSDLGFEWLEPPSPNGEITVMDVLVAGDPRSHVQSVQRWAADIWSAWAGHHRPIRGWLEAGLGA